MISGRQSGHCIGIHEPQGSEFHELTEVLSTIAARTGQEWVEFETWPFVALEETGTTAPARCLGAVVPNSTAGGAGQPSYTVRTVGPDILNSRVTVSEFSQ